MFFTINSRCVDFIFAISSIADFEYTVNLIGCDPGAKSRTLKSFTFLTSIPGSAPIALDISEPFLVTNKTLFPTFLLLPLSLDCPERDFLDSNLVVSCVSFNESNIFEISLAFDTPSISSETIIGNDSIPSTLCPLNSTSSFDAVAAIAET